MARAHTIQTNFTSGEVSPVINGRVDVERYYNGAQEIQNFIVRPQGGLTRRSGTRFIYETKDSSKACRLYPFEFSTTQAYILEFGEGYVRFYADGGIVEASPGVILEVATPYQEADLDTLYFAQSADVLYICHPSYQPRTLERASATSWSLNLFVATDGPYLDENKTDIEVEVTGVTDRATITSDEADFGGASPGEYVEYDDGAGDLTIAEIVTVVSAQELTVKPLENVKPNLPEEVVGVTVPAAAGNYVVSLAAVFDYTYVNYHLRMDPNSNAGYVAADRWRLCTNYIDDGTRGTTTTDIGDEVVVGAPLALAAPAVGGRLTLSDRIITATITATDSIWTSDDVGRLFRMRFDDKAVWAKVTGYSSSTSVSVELGGPMPLKERNGNEYKNDGKTKTWRNGAWGQAAGWPSCVIFHEERLWFANTDNQTQTIWASKTGDFTNFAPTDGDAAVLDDSALNYTIASNRVNEIQWLDSGPSLLIGTVGGEWQLKSSATSQPISPTNVSITPQTAYGSLRIQPERIGPAVLFAQRSGVSMREFVYRFESDSYQASDMNVVSEHLFKVNGQIKDFAYQQSPDSILYVLADNGVLMSLTYLRDQQVFSWARHILGGTDVEVESVASIPAGNTDELWMVVKRTVNGATARYVEQLQPLFRLDSDATKEDAFFVDSGLTYNGAATSTITGLSHLEGETVAVLVDGAVETDKVVSGGSITLDSPGSVVHAGLPYRSLLHTLPPEGGGDSGTAQGKIKRVDNLILRLFESLEFQHGDTLEGLVTKSFRADDDSMDDSPALFTGDIQVRISQSYERDADYYVVQDAAYPLTILAVMPEMVVSR